MSSRLTAATFVAVLAPLVAAPVVGPGLREIEVQCEEAKAHLEECCPTSMAHIQCEYVDSCDPEPPTLDVSQSKRIRRLACSEIVRDGLCEDGRRSPPPLE